MSRCEIYGDCWFYKSTIDPQSQAFELLQKYCHGDYSACARYQFSLSLGNFYVPKGLLPNDVRRIKPVLRSLIWQALLRILPFTWGGQIHTFSEVWSSAHHSDESNHLIILSYKKWVFICHLLNSPIDWDLPFHYFIDNNTLSIVFRLLLKKKLESFAASKKAMKTKPRKAWRQFVNSWVMGYHSPITWDLLPCAWLCPRRFTSIVIFAHRVVKN